MDEKNCSSIILKARSGGTLKFVYKAGKIIVSYNDFVSFLRSQNIPYEIENEENQQQPDSL